MMMNKQLSLLCACLALMAASGAAAAAFDQQQQQQADHDQYAPAEGQQQYYASPDEQPIQQQQQQPLDYGVAPVQPPARGAVRGAVGERAKGMLSAASKRTKEMYERAQPGLQAVRSQLEERVAKLKSDPRLIQSRDTVIRGTAPLIAKGTQRVSNWMTSVSKHAQAAANQAAAATIGQPQQQPQPQPQSYFQGQQQAFENYQNIPMDSIAPMEPLSKQQQSAH